jgi:hypothetical protein
VEVANAPRDWEVSALSEILYRPEGEDEMGTKYLEYNIGGKGNLSSLCIISSLPFTWPTIKPRKQTVGKQGMSGTKSRFDLGFC